MSLTVRDICRNADVFRAAYPNWPHAEPDRAPLTYAEASVLSAAATAAACPVITAISPAVLTEDEYQMLLEDRWREAAS